MPTTWMIPAPDDALAQRVTLTLGLGAAQRFFREVAVPGIGGAAFVRHCSWAAGALALYGQHEKETPVRIAHAVEALACKLAHRHRPQGESDGRVRGIRAFARSPEAWSFRELSLPRHYVLITHRQSVVTALATEVGLSFASGGRRFNAMTLTRHGEDLAAAFLDQRVGRGGGSLSRLLLAWMAGEAGEAEVTSQSMATALSPWIPKASAEGVHLQDRLRADHASVASLGPRTRPRLLTVLDQLGRDQEPTLGAVLSALKAMGADDQARGISVAVAFEALVENGRRVVHAAAQRLEQTERSQAPAAELADGVVRALDRLVQSAHRYRAATEVAGISHPEANVMTAELIAAATPADLVRSLVRRDGQILAVGDGAVIRRGPLFASWKPVGDDTDADQTDVEHGLRSPRLRQAYQLWIDCYGT